MAFAALTAVAWLQRGMAWIVPIPALRDLTEKAVPQKVGHVIYALGRLQT